MQTTDHRHGWRGSAWIVLALVLAGVAAGCSNPPGPNTRRGAAGGAVAGAVIGGIIGHQSGETGEGAALGAAVGGLAGGMQGNRRDAVATEYTNADYLALLTAEERATLEARARASGRGDYNLADFLTEQEKANLRARASRQIGR